MSNEKDETSELVAEMLDSPAWGLVFNTILKRRAAALRRSLLTGLVDPLEYKATVGNLKLLKEIVVEVYKAANRDATKIADQLSGAEER